MMTKENHPAYTKGLEAGLLRAYQIALANEKGETANLFATSSLILLELDEGHGLGGTKGG